MGDALGHFGHPLSSSLKSSTECNSVQKGRLIFKKSISYWTVLHYSSIGGSYLNV